MNRFADAWNRFWFAEGTAHGLAMFRMLMGVYWLVHWLPLAPFVRLVLSEEGMHFPFVYYPSANLDAVGRFYGWLTQPVSMPVATVLYVLLIASIVCLMIGWHTRKSVAAYILLYTYYYMLYLHPLNSSFGRMTFIMTALLVFSPAGAVWSLDARRARRRGAPLPSTYPLWSQRAICLQVSFIYVGTALFKIHSEGWNKGEMVATSLMGDWATPVGYWLTRFDWSWGVYDLIVLSTITFEMWAGLLLWHPRWQRWVFLIGTIFHVQVAVTLSIWHFLFLPISYVLFVEPERVRDRVEGWRQARAARRAAA